MMKKEALGKLNEVAALLAHERGWRWRPGVAVHELVSIDSDASLRVVAFGAELSLPAQLLACVQPDWVQTAADATQRLECALQYMRCAHALLVMMGEAGFTDATRLSGLSLELAEELAWGLSVVEAVPFVPTPPNPFREEAPPDPSLWVR